MRKNLLLAAAATAATLLLAGGSANASEPIVGRSLPLAFFAERMVANSQSAAREHTAVARAVRTVLGVSFVDIEKHGILGGPNSELRKILGIRL
jgi:hypothetical protein